MISLYVRLTTVCSFDGEILLTQPKYGQVIFSSIIFNAIYFGDGEKKDRERNIRRDKQALKAFLKVIWKNIVDAS